MGRAALRELTGHGEAVTATHTGRRGDQPALPGVTWVKWDATLEPLPAVEWDRIAAILHLAAPPNLFDFPGQAAAMYEITVAATFRLLEAARRYDIPRFVLASTGDVLGPSEGLAKEEDRLYLPTSFYGAAKAAAEILLRSYETLLSTALLRFYHPYGPGGGRFLINRLLGMVAEGKEVTIEGENGILLNPVWIEDLARGVFLALQSRETGVFHLAGPDTETLRALLLRMGEIVGKPAVIRAIPGPGVERHAGSFTNSERLLGYRPRVSLNEGLRRLASS